MKIENLMIGNWVRYKDDYPSKLKAGTTVQIVGVKAPWVYVKFDESDPHEEHYSSIEPISLTSEILEKNGFKNITQKLESIEQYIHLYELSDDIVLGELPIGFNVCIEKYNGDWDIYEHHIVFTIRYVHELQHALRLCKIDKEIKL